MIGHGISANKKSGCVGETEIGIGGTSAWKIAALSPRTSVGVYFEVVSGSGNAASAPMAPNARKFSFLFLFMTGTQTEIVSRWSDSIRHALSTFLWTIPSSRNDCG
jgi:hypothetical protein